jgi:hypothetical protein
MPSAGFLLQVLPNSLLSVTPERGQVAAEGSAELEVALLLTQPGPLSTVLELDLRGGKILKLPIRYAVACFLCDIVSKSSPANSASTRQGGTRKRVLLSTTQPSLHC